MDTIMTMRTNAVIDLVYAMMTNAVTDPEYVAFLVFTWLQGVQMDTRRSLQLVSQSTVCHEALELHGIGSVAALLVTESSTGRTRAPRD